MPKPKTPKRTGRPERTAFVEVTLPERDDPRALVNLDNVSFIQPAEPGENAGSANEVGSVLHFVECGDAVQVLETYDELSALVLGRWDDRNETEEDEG